MEDIRFVSTTKEVNAPEPPPPPAKISKFITLQDWLLHICNTEIPNESIIAYHFGLFETEQGYTIYLTGSKCYDQDNQNWATNYDFEPSDKYFPLPTSEYKSLKWEQVQVKIQNQLKDFTKTDKYINSFFANAKVVTTGFDNGDLVKIK